MKSRFCFKLLALIFATSLAVSAFAQEKTAPFSAAEKESAYNAAIEKRSTNILAALQLADAAKAARVHDAIIAQYRALRARDEALDVMFAALAQNSPGIQTNREVILPILTASLHAKFVEALSADLTPSQVEMVKDKMTYNKVQVTFDAYCVIIPNLSDAEKAMILKQLKEAREEAIDGGNADEKTAIFQKHKERINSALAANGHDIIKATKDWEAKQEQANAAQAKPTQ